MDSALYALIVEDSQPDALLLLRELKRAGYEVDYLRVENEDTMRAALETRKWDVVISDFSMPTFSATAALNILQEKELDIPFIIVSGTMGEEAAVTAMKAGAHDYFAKGRLGRLGAAINRELRDAKERKRRKEAENELRALYNATSFLFKADNLTGLGQQIVHAVVDEFKQFDCGLILLHPKDKQLLRLARSGSYHVDTNLPLFQDGEGLVPEAIRSGRTIYVPDVSRDSRYLKNQAQTKSELVIPLKTAKGIVGVLDLQSVQYDAFSESDQRLLLAFAERAAVAIEMRMLYEEINQYALELEERVEERTHELRITKERSEAIFNNSSDAIVLIDKEGYIQQTNQAFQGIFGYSLEEVINKSLLELCKTDNRELLAEYIQRVLTRHSPERLELLAERIDGSFFDVDLALSPTSDSASQELNIICSFRDITEAKALEVSLRQTIAKEQELSRLKIRFTAMVSHEFRTPLATIQSSSDLIKHYNNRLTDEKRMDYLNKIQKQVKHLTDMVDNILLVGKSEATGIAFNPVGVNLQLYAQNIVDEIQAISERHQIRFNASGDFPNMNVDTRLLRQMLLNLLTNAIKYSPNGGTINFDLSCLEKEAIFSITDNGIGIPEADMERLFEAFHRADNVTFISGTGLGLTIVKLAIDAHKGAVEVKSAMNQGTTFTIRFPRQD